MAAAAGALSNSSSHHPETPAGSIPIGVTPLARILAHESAYWTVISRVTQGPGCKFFANPIYRNRFDPNHAGEFRGQPGDGPALVQAIVDFYQPQGLTPVAYVDDLSTPADLEQHLIAAGFIHQGEWDGDLMLYVGPDLALDPATGPATGPTQTVELAADEASRRAWSSIVEDETTPDYQGLMQQMYYTQVSDSRVRAYLGSVDGAPAARCQLFSQDGLGRVEAVRTLAPYRKRGLAAAVVRAAVQDSLALGNTLTYLYANPGGDGQRLYAQLGFRTVAARVVRTYIYSRSGEHRA